jgi:hypothetical protein
MREKTLQELSQPVGVYMLECNECMHVWFFCVYTNYAAL